MTAAANAIQASQKEHRLEFLDAARGIAALAVVVQHSLESCIPRFLPWSVHHINFGAFGVVMFFIVSGFIIPVSIERSAKLAKFWTNRFFRLYPMYWVSLITVLLLACFKLVGLPAAFLVHPIVGTLANFTMLQTFVHIPDALAVYWTLSLELVFYVLSSLLFAAGWQGRSRLWGWVAAGTMASCVLLAAWEFHRSLPAGRLGLLVTAFVGAAIFRALSDGASRGSLYALLAATFGTFLAGFWFRFHIYPSRDETGWNMVGVSASWALAYGVFAVLILLRKHRFPEWILWVGRISYSLYLLHGVVLALLPRNLNPFIFLLASIGSSVLISAVTYKLVEEPAIAFHRKRTRNRSLKTASATG